MRITPFIAALMAVATVPTIATALTPAEPVSHVVFTEGINGGYAGPPHARRQGIILPDDSGATIWIVEQPRRDGPKTVRTGRLDRQAYADVLSVLRSESLFELPLEDPSGGADIYGLDTSLRVRIGNDTWHNRGPDSCMRRGSVHQASAAQRKTFQKLANAVTRLAERAQSPSTETAYQAALDTVEDQTL